MVALSPLKIPIAQNLDVCSKKAGNLESAQIAVEHYRMLVGYRVYLDYDTLGLLLTLSQ